MKIGKKLKELRTQNGLTLEELANRSELTKGFLSQLERDLTSPNISALEYIGSFRYQFGRFLSIKQGRADCFPYAGFFCE